MFNSEFKISSTSLFLKIKSFVPLLDGQLYGAKVLKKQQDFKNGRMILFILLRWLISDP